MNRNLLCSALAAGLSSDRHAADAAKPKKQESEVQKSLKEAYPDAETQITGTNDVNGVKVYDVAVKSQGGESTAQITEYGDFLMYGVPHERTAAIQQRDPAGRRQASSRAKPEDIADVSRDELLRRLQGAQGEELHRALRRRRPAARHRQRRAQAGQSAKPAAGDQQRRTHQRTKQIVRSRSTELRRSASCPKPQLEAVYPASEHGQGFCDAHDSRAAAR